jgi:hypothetical protein
MQQQNINYTIRQVTEQDLAKIRSLSVSRGFVGSENTVCIADVLELDGKLLLMGGFIIITPCTAWAWVELTEEGINHIHLSYKTVKKWLEKQANIYGIKRLQAYVLESFPEAQRFAEHLGFKVESVMKDFVPDGNAIMYVRMM